MTGTHREVGAGGVEVGADRDRLLQTREGA